MFRVLIAKLAEAPYASIIAYPEPTETELAKRIKELGKLQIKALVFKGEKQIANVPILGKGCVGIVAIAQLNGEKAALKIRRVDADRSRMQHEAEMLKKANSVGVGPRLMRVSKNFLLMQLVNGCLLPGWLEKRREKANVRKILHDVLEQCWRLDKACVDHGELSQASKHIIVANDSRAVIVDFETASTNRRPSNVTSVCQFLFMSGISEKVAERIGEKDRNTIVEALRYYKKCRKRENFERVLNACGV
jgi:putative serine/threonine protein kinase